MSKPANKRILVIFAILLVLVVLVILGSTMFRLKGVEVKFRTSAPVYQLKAEEIAESCGIYCGKNLLFLSKKEVQAHVAGLYPYAKNVAVVRSFPNAMTIYLEERTEVFTVQLPEEEGGGEVYWMFDREGVALRTDEINRTNMNLADYDENVKITGIGVDDLAAPPKAGQRLQLREISKLNCLRQVLDSLTSFGYTDLTLRNFIRSVDVSNLRDGLTLTTRSDGPASTKIYISRRTDGGGFESQIPPAIRQAVGTWNAWSVDYEERLHGGTMRVQYDATLGTYVSTYERNA